MSIDTNDDWDDLGWAWDELFDDEDVIVYVATACSLENPETCESCS